MFNKSAKLEQYYIKLLLGIILVVGIFFMKDHVETEHILEKSKSMGIKYRHFDMMYLAGMFIAAAGSVYLILPSMVYLVRNGIRKKAH